MKKVCAMSLSLLLLLAAGIEGLVTSQRSTCKCQKISSRTIHSTNVAKFEVFPATFSCNKVEYIVTRKLLGYRQCLDPTLPEVQTLYKQYQASKKTHGSRPRRSQ